MMGLLKAVRGGLGGGVDLMVAVVAERARMFAWVVACVGACVRVCVCVCVCARARVCVGRGCVLSRAVVHVIIKCMLLGRTYASSTPATARASKVR